jgi:hypothetical protein
MTDDQDLEKSKRFEVPVDDINQNGKTANEYDEE